MKISQLLYEDDVAFKVEKRSEINRAVAAMSMSNTIDFTIELNYVHPSHHPLNHPSKTIGDLVDMADDEYDTLRKIITKHSKYNVSGLGSGLMSTSFDHRNQLKQLKACLEEIADYLDPKRENAVWSWTVTVTDDEGL